MYGGHLEFSAISDFSEWVPCSFLSYLPDVYLFQVLWFSPFLIFFTNRLVTCYYYYPSVTIFYTILVYNEIILRYRWKSIHIRICWYWKGICVQIVCTRFVLKKNHLAVSYPYIRAENSSSGCISIHRGFCKMLELFCFI